jgi:tetratricopeptide (TPR) repeat protein
MEQSIKPSTGENFLYVAIRYKAAIISALVLVIAIGVGSFFWMQHQKTSEQEAALKLSRISPLLDQGDFQTAIYGQSKVPGLKKIAAEYAGKFTGTPSGNMANLLLANAWYSLGEFDSALNVFKNVSTANNDLAAAALAGAGDCYFNKNQFAPAAESYQDASKKADNSVLKALYLTHAANSFQQSNQFKKAAELYTKIIADYPGTTGAAVAQRSLWQISGNL